VGRNKFFSSFIFRRYRSSLDPYRGEFTIILIKGWDALGKSGIR